VDIVGGGEGFDAQVTATIQSRGVAPVLVGVRVDGSAYTGVNITTKDGPVFIRNVTVTYSKGKSCWIKADLL
jgi:hypothetical protein